MTVIHSNRIEKTIPNDLFMNIIKKETRIVAHSFPVDCFKSCQNY